jgi:hypothetical protein
MPKPKEAVSTKFTLLYCIAAVGQGDAGWVSRDWIDQALRLHRQVTGRRWPTVQMRVAMAIGTLLEKGLLELDNELVRASDMGRIMVGGETLPEEVRGLPYLVSLHEEDFVCGICNTKLTAPACTPEGLPELESNGWARCQGHRM